MGKVGLQIDKQTHFLSRSHTCTHARMHTHRHTQTRRHTDTHALHFSPSFQRLVAGSQHAHVTVSAGAIVGVPASPRDQARHRPVSQRGCRSCWRCSPSHLSIAADARAWRRNSTFSHQSISIIGVTSIAIFSSGGFGCHRGPSVPHAVHGAAPVPQPCRCALWRRTAAVALSAVAAPHAGEAADSRCSDGGQRAERGMAAGREPRAPHPSRRRGERWWGPCSAQELGCGKQQRLEGAGVLSGSGADASPGFCSNCTAQRWGQRGCGGQCWAKADWQGVWLHQLSPATNAAA